LFPLCEVPFADPFNGTAFAAFPPSMHATFFQKVIICAVAAFLAAALIEWGKVFVTGADDALNGGYKHDATAVTQIAKP
jgi:hypothetical protein